MEKVVSFTKPGTKEPLIKDNNCRRCENTIETQDHLYECTNTRKKSEIIKMKAETLINERHKTTKIYKILRKEGLPLHSSRITEILDITNKNFWTKPEAREYPKI